jgi:tetratricopeptide (TPR) repeat protein
MIDDRNLMNPSLLQLLKELIILELKHKHNTDLRNGGFKKIVDVVEGKNRTLSANNLERRIFTNGLTQSFVHREYMREGLVMFLEETFHFGNFERFRLKFLGEKEVDRFERGRYKSFKIRRQYSGNDRAIFDRWAREKSEQLFKEIASFSTEIVTQSQKGSVPMYREIPTGESFLEIINPTQVRLFQEEISKQWNLTSDLSRLDSDGLIHLVSEELFTYHYNNKTTWIENNPKLPLIERLIRHAMDNGVFSKSLLNLLLNYGWLVQHKNLVEDAAIKFAEANKVLSKIKSGLSSEEHFLNKDRILHYNIQVSHYPLLHENQLNYCNQFSDREVKTFSHFKCVACILVKQKLWNEAAKYIGQCEEMIDSLSKNPALHHYHGGTKIFKRSYLYSLAYFYRTATEFYLKTNHPDLSIAHKYADASLRYFRELGYTDNTFDIAINYYHLYRIHSRPGKSIKARDYYRQKARASRIEGRAGNFLMNSCLVDMNEIDRDLEIKDNWF